MYIVTGGAGFIGANIVDGLNQRGETEILVVDNLLKGDKFLNLRDLDIADYMDKTAFLDHVRKGMLHNTKISAIFHQGACSDTMEYDGRYMMDNNFTYSKTVLHGAIDKKIPFVYASSASVYGASTTFVEHPDNEQPLNVYGYSKLLFDRYVARLLPHIKSTVAGLRYFNVYGPREEHKGRMASMVHQLHQQLLTTGTAHLFEGSGGYGDGEQERDFISVADVVQINLFLAQQKRVQGVFNVGTGQCRSFNAIAQHLCKRLGSGEIRYKPMPETLLKKYQNFTQADIARLRRVGWDQPFTSLEAGIDILLKGGEKRSTTPQTKAEGTPVVATAEKKPVTPKGAAAEKKTVTPKGTAAEKKTGTTEGVTAEKKTGTTATAATKKKPDTTEGAATKKKPGTTEATAKKKPGTTKGTTAEKKPGTTATAASKKKPDTTEGATAKKKSKRATGRKKEKSTDVG